MRTYTLESIYYNNIFITESAKDRYMSLFEGMSQSSIKIAEDNVSWAIKKLKKDDAIMWYLRFIKLYLIEKREINTNNPSLEKWKNRFIFKTYKDVDDEDKKIDLLSFYRGGIEYIRTKLEHYYSYQIPEIINYEYGWKPFRFVINEFDRYETEWKYENSDEGWINITDELNDGSIEIIKEYPDGFAWMDLKRNYCKREGNAMGHCGNSASYRSDDTVLSFRKIKTRGDVILARPSLTFILNSSGHLGEMKGRENKKPKDKYHPYIIDLLLLKKGNYWLVKDVVGGGYEPSNNFSLDDLTLEQRTSLFKNRPDLEPLYDVYKREGLTPSIVKDLEKLDRFVKLEKTNYGYNCYFKDFENIEDFSSRINSRSDIMDYIKYYTGEKDYSDSYIEVYSDKDILYHFYDTIIKDKRIHNLLKDIITGELSGEWEDWNEENPDADVNDERDQFEFLYEIYDDFNTAISDAYRYGVESGTEQSMYKAVRNALEDAEIEIGDEDTYTKCGVQLSENFEGPVYTIVDLEYTLKIHSLMISNNAESPFEYNDQKSYDVAVNVSFNEPQYGFDGFDKEYAIEHFASEMGFKKKSKRMLFFLD